MAHKTFKRAMNLDPIWFEIPDRDDNDVRFNCNDDMPAGVVLAFSGELAGQDADTAGSAALASVHELFNTAVVEEQHERFWSLINDRKGKVSIGMLVEVASWLTEQYTARPTGPSSESGSSVTPSGPDSTAGASPTVTTYSKPELTAVST